MLLELCMPLVKVDGLFLAMKGSKGEEEIQESINALKILNGEIIKIQKTKLVTDNDERMNIFIKKTDEISMKYPRAYGQIKKSPL